MSSLIAHSGPSGPSVINCVKNQWVLNWIFCHNFRSTTWKNHFGSSKKPELEYQKDLETKSTFGIFELSKS